MSKLTWYFIAIILCVTGISYKAFAHGEDKPGPHGGFIKMPGAFHTEVVPVNENTFKLYLLDISFAAPITTNSWVKASVVTGDKKSEADCKESTDFFLCVLPKGTNLKSGKLEVQAKRSDAQGISMGYELPLQQEKTGHPENHARSSKPKSMSSS